MYILLALYLLILISLNGYEIITQYKKWKEIMIKYKKQIPLTLLYTFVLNPLSLFLTEKYVLSDLQFVYSLIFEILIFILSINIFDIYIGITHYIEHKYFYKYHKVHHQIRETCITLTLYNNIIDQLIISVPYYFLPNILGFSKMSYYVFISFTLLQSMIYHKIYDDKNKDFTYHNYHHYNQSKNYSSGFIGTFSIVDRILGTYVDTKKIKNS